MLKPWIGFANLKVGNYNSTQILCCHNKLDSKINCKNFKVYTKKKNIKKGRLFNNCITDSFINSITQFKYCVIINKNNFTNKWNNIDLF